MENEQGPRLHHVHPLFRLRRRLADVRVPDSGLPGVGQPGQRSRGSRGIKNSFLRKKNTSAKRTHTYGSRHHHRHRHRRVSADERTLPRFEEEIAPVISTLHVKGT